MIPIASPILDEQAIKDVETVIRSGKLVQGQQVQAFEEAFAKYIGVPFAIAVNSGTAALHISLVAAGIKPGDEIITTPFSFVASSNSILMCGAKPVFADIEADTCNINPGLIKAKINLHTKAIVGVHLYGQAFDVDALEEICKENGLALIEDACQSHGAEYKGHRVGSFGIGSFSFYPTKNMTTSEGGMVTTNDQKIADICRLLRSHGQRERYCHVILGYNYRMTEIEAAIGLGQLARLEEFNRRRMENAAFLTREISSIPGLIPPVVHRGSRHVFHQYTIRVIKPYPLTRDQLIEHLQKKGIGSAVHYPLPIHQQPYYKDLGYRDSLPVAEQACREVISIPVHPSLTQSDLNSIVEALRHA